MKEKLYTIPLNDAVNANDECPFCYIEKNVEQDLLDFVLGSGASYMESDVRAATDQAGFCRTHFHKMFHYGNTLGNGWILKTHYMQMLQEMKKEFQNFTPSHTSFLGKFRKSQEETNTVSQWIQAKEDSCYICKRYADDYQRYLSTFFYLYKKDADFRRRIHDSKGFCLHHFKDLCQKADTELTDSEKTEFYPAMFRLMEEHMERILGDVSWLIEKFDYRNKDADWKNSKDAVQRAMQKLKGGYPAE